MQAVDNTSQASETRQQASANRANVTLVTEQSELRIRQPVEQARESNAVFLSGAVENESSQGSCMNDDQSVPLNFVLQLLSSAQNQDGVAAGRMCSELGRRLESVRVAAEQLGHGNLEVLCGELSCLSKSNVALRQEVLRVMEQEKSLESQIRAKEERIQALEALDPAVLEKLLDEQKAVTMRYKTQADLLREELRAGHLPSNADPLLLKLQAESDAAMIEQLNEEISLLRHRVSQLQIHAQEARDSQRQYNALMQQVQTNAEEAASATASLTRELAKEREEAMRLKMELEKTTQKLSASQQKEANLLKDIHEFQKEVAASIAALEQAEQNAARKAQEDAEALRITFLQLDDAKAEVRAILDAKTGLEETVTKLQASLEAARLREELREGSIAAAQERLSSESRAQAVLLVERQRAEKAEAALEVSKAVRETLQQELFATRAELGAAAEALTAARLDVQQMAKKTRQDAEVILLKEDEIGKLKERLIDAQDALRAKERDLSGTAARLTALREQQTELTDRVARRETELFQGIRSQILTSGAALEPGSTDRLDAFLREMRANDERRDVAMNTLRERADILRGEKVAFQEEVLRLTGLLSQAQEKLSSTEQELNETRRAKALMEAELLEATKARADLRQKLSEMRENATLTASGSRKTEIKMGNAERAADDLRTKLAVLQRELCQKDNEIAAVKHRASEQERLASEATTRVQELDDQLKQTQEAVLQAAKQEKKAANEATALRRELDAQRVLIDEIEQKMMRSQPHSLE